jgi:serine/threonine protein phosphatase PrpC
MVSDGIAESGEDARLVVEALCRRDTDDAQSVAKSVLAHAREKHGARDDMTVSVVRIGSANGREM